MSDGAWRTKRPTFLSIPNQGMSLPRSERSRIPLHENAGGAKVRGMSRAAASAPLWGVLRLAKRVSCAYTGFVKSNTMVSPS